MSARIRALLVAATMLLPSLLMVGAPSATSAQDLTVLTADGAIAGVVEGGGHHWRGIPYAAPPVGQLRWQAPGPVSPWSGVRDGTEFAEPCAQPDLETGGLRGSEDCLHLNVSTPDPAEAGDGLPVMVHLHGGSNNVGWPMDNTAAFTERGVVVVTVAYRLGAFGFVGHPALSSESGGSSGEYGLLDQVAALRWVRDNIAEFGGDPANVTLFGLSAGSFDTVALMASPLSRGLMTRAAVQGEVTWAWTGQFNTVADAENLGLDLAERVGCADAVDAAACLRAIPAEQLATTAGRLDLLPWVGGRVLPRSPRDLLGEGSVPLLVGFDQEEDSVFLGPPPPDYSRRSWIRDTNLVTGPTTGNVVRRLYSPEAYGSLWWAYVTLVTDAVRGCPTRQLAGTVATHAPVWRWLYAHTIEHPLFRDFRASHGHEDFLLWQLADQFDIELSPGEHLLADQMTDYWTNFAKTGDPNGPGLPTWPPYETATEPILVLDTPTGTATGYHRDECAVLDAVPILFPYPWEFGTGAPTLPVWPRPFR